MKLKEKFSFIWKTLKRAGRFLWRVFKSNMYLKLASVFFAFLIWSYVIAAENPQRPMTLGDVSVSYNGISELTEKNLTIDNDSLVQTVDVLVLAGQNYHKNVTTNTVKASVDLSAINTTGEYELPVHVTVSVSGASITSITPSTITVKVDDLVERAVPVRCVLEGNRTDGYYIGEPTLEENYVIISGAREKIEDIVEAVVTIPIDGLEESVRASYTANLLDTDGNIVSADSVNGTVPSVIVSLEVLPMKTVKIDTALALRAVTNVKEGYEAVDVSLNPEEVQIVGDADVLAAINAVQIKPLSAGDADTSVLLEGELQSITGVQFVNGTDVDVYVQINEEQTEKMFENIAISTTNLDKGLRATLSVTYTDIMVSGNKSDMAGVKRADVVAFVDLTGLTAGTYILPVKVEEIAGIDSSGITIEDTSVTVVIR